MSSALSSSPPSAEPAFDLDYSIHDFEVDPCPDSQFVFRRVEAVMLREGLVPGGRTLDVACGTGQLGVQITGRGGEGWGIDPSPEMLGISRWLYQPDRVVLARGAFAGVIEGFVNQNRGMQYRWERWFYPLVGGFEELYVVLSAIKQTTFG